MYKKIHNRNGIVIGVLLALVLLLSFFPGGREGLPEGEDGKTASTVAEGTAESGRNEENKNLGSLNKGDEGQDTGDVSEEGKNPSEKSVSESSSETLSPGRAFMNLTASGNLRDNTLLYPPENRTNVTTMYLTVRRGNQAEGTDHSWEEVNRYSVYDYQRMGVERYQVEGLLQLGDETGVLPDMLGYGETAANATVQIRGQTSSREPQKNYKIRLKKNHGDWEGQQTIDLNKHKTDGMRFRNKLGFDLISEIPELMGLRTRFVHLYVKDETGGAEVSPTPEKNHLGYVDYGLFTQVEQLNKSALRAHGLDRNGQLYKLNFFEFQRYPEQILPANAEDYDEAAFEELLEVKGNTDHSKLISMLEDVNDPTIPLEELLEKHFNIENLCYWMAYHILTGNIDTQSRNVYLYSPGNKKTWYFYSWDLDGAFRQEENRQIEWADYGSWERGISNYWGNQFFRRCLKSEKFREALSEAVEDIRKNYLTEENIREKVQSYLPITRSYSFQDPDVVYEPVSESDYDRIAEQLPRLPEFYYENYLDSLDCPMPFFIGTPTRESGELKLQWESSYDLKNEAISYTAVLAKNYDMTEELARYEGEWTEMTLPNLPEGQYFVKLSCKNSSGRTQDAFDSYESVNGKVHGVKCFYVLSDGSIVEDSAAED